MTNFVINSHGRYFYLSNEVAGMLKVEDLVGCKTFPTMESFYNEVHKLYPAVSSVEELYGSYLELWYDDEIDKVVIDHGFIDGEFDIEHLAQQISEFEGE